MILYTMFFYFLLIDNFSVYASQVPLSLQHPSMCQNESDDICINYHQFSTSYIQQHDKLLCNSYIQQHEALQHKNMQEDPLMSESLSHKLQYLQDNQLELNNLSQRKKKGSCISWLCRHISRSHVYDAIEVKK